MYRDKVKEMRNDIEDKKKNETSSDTSQSDQYAGKDLEPDILNCSNISSYDLNLFREAQAVASEKIVSTLFNINKNFFLFDNFKNVTLSFFYL